MLRALWGLSRFVCWGRGWPGVRPGGRPTYLARTRKVGIRSAPHWPCPLRGNLRCSGAGRRCRTRFVRFALVAQTAAASQSTKRACCAARPALLGTATRGFEVLTRAIAALGLGLISAAASRGGFAPSPSGRGQGRGPSSSKIVAARAFPTSAGAVFFVQTAMYRPGR